MKKKPQHKKIARRSTEKKGLSSIDDLKEWDRNPREISTQALDGLKYSLAEFGDLSGIVYNRKLGALVAGHQRVRALREEHGPLKIEDDLILIPGREPFKIRLVDWDENKHAAANIAANNQHLAGTYTEGLAMLMDGLEATSASLFERLRMDRLKVDHEEFWNEDRTKEDTAPPLPATPRTKPGDLYELAGHRLLCGDATSEKAVDRLTVGFERARLVFTDPPYNVAYASDSLTIGRQDIKNDDLSQDQSTALFVGALREAHRVTADDATLYWWFASENVVPNRQSLLETGWHHSQTVIWLKNSLVFSPGVNYHRTYEPCMVAWKQGRRGFQSRILNGETDVWNLERRDFEEQLDIWYERRDPVSQYLHPTQKPVRLAERALKKNSRPQDIVLDLFAGSGSTMIAAEQMDRRCFMVELDPAFCDVIVSRFCTFTGRESIRLNGKETKWKG